MKILAIGRNYAAHASEMGSKVPEQPIVFMKPQMAVLKNNKPFDFPPFSQHIEYELELVLKISRNGKNIPENKASDYFQEIGLGIDFTARDIQKNCKENGWPWEVAKAFDHSAPVSQFISISELKNAEDIKFHLEKNGETVQEGMSSQMIFSFDQIIAYTSRFFTLNIGDLIFTGTPKGVGPVEVGDKLEAFLEGKQMLTCEIKSPK